MRILYEDQIKGRTVIDAGGRALGAVDGLYLDADTLHPEAIRVKLRSEAAQALGVPHGTFRAGTIDVSTEHIQALGDTIVLRIDARTLKQPEPEAPPPPEPVPSH